MPSKLLGCIGFLYKLVFNLLRATTHLVVLGIKEMACVTHKFTRGLSKRQVCPLWSAFTQEGAGKQQQQQQQQ